MCLLSHTSFLSSFPSCPKVIFYACHVPGFSYLFSFFFSFFPSAVAFTLLFIAPTISNFLSSFLPTKF
uniref:Uncharacterized protein n=1 Tax=Manihot esculenta TaxID=3983 RepID=A0A2C9WG62_MANES